MMDRFLIIKIIVPALLLCALLYSPKSQAANLSCRTQAPFVQVNPIIRPIQYIRSVSSEELTRSQNQSTHGGHFVGGTGGGRIGLDTEIHFETKTLGSRGCLSIKSIKGIYYAEPVIHIASEFKQGSCEYKAILEHEKKHIKVMKNFHRKYDFKIKQELRKIAKYYQSKGPIAASRIDDQQAYIHKEIQKHIGQYNDQIMSELAKKQDRVDTPEEYARVAAKCKGWNRVHLH